MRVYVKKISVTMAAQKAADNQTTDQAVKAKKKYVIWGDFLDVEDDPSSSKHYLVNWKAFDSKTGTVRIEVYRIAKADCQAEPLLEMIFLDVGQGDGCIVSIPDGNSHKVMIVDAGEGNNLHRFLKWRFRYVDSSANFHAAIITHSDTDHYKGFQPIFDDSRVSFGHVYHNGLVERAGTSDLGVLGAISPDGGHERRCLDPIETKAQLTALLDPLDGSGRRSGKLYPKLMATAIASPVRFPDIAMMSVLHGTTVGGIPYLPGFAPDADKPNIEVLGPISRRDAGKVTLPAFGDAPRDNGFSVAKTKNGNSVVLKLNYRNLRVIFGGDMNKPSEDFMLRHYSGISVAQPLVDAIPVARLRLGADILKCCHHGSADVNDEFVAAINPFAFVVSSGDEESHVHPRPEILGMLGRNGRGARPMLLCTEILRSTPESLRLNARQSAERAKLEAALDAAVTSVDRKIARKAINAFWDARFRRLVNVYGAVTVRSDGNQLLVAFRKEVSTGNPWQLYLFKFQNGDWAGTEIEKKRKADA